MPGGSPSLLRAAAIAAVGRRGREFNISLNMHNAAWPRGARRFDTARSPAAARRTGCARARRVPRPVSGASFRQSDRVDR